MARSAGVEILRAKKRVEVASTVHLRRRGSHSCAARPCAETGISGDIRVKDLTDEQLVALRGPSTSRESFKVEEHLPAQGRRRHPLRCRDRQLRGYPPGAQPPRSAASAPRRTLKARKGPEGHRGRQEEGALAPRAPCSRSGRNGSTPSRPPCRGARKKRRTSLWARPTSRARSPTPSSRSPTPTGAVISWASSGGVGFKGVLACRLLFAAPQAAGKAARQAQEHGMKKAGYLPRAGPRAGSRPRSVLAPPAHLEVGFDQRRHPAGAQRPPADKSAVASNPLRVAPQAAVRRPRRLAVTNTLD